MKHTIAITAALLALAACGQKDAAPSASAQAETVTPAPTEPTSAAPEVPTVTPAAAPVAAPADPSAEFASLPAPYNTADYARGRRTWKLCQSCHITAEGGGNLVGPNLHGVFGRQAGSLEGFAYSDALASADFIWTPDKVDHWLENPRTFLAGNRMTFAGVRKPEDRTAVIAYLMVETGYSAEADSTPEE